MIIVLVICYEAALKYISKCSAMKGVYTKYNKMTERWESLHLNQSTTDKFSKSWNMVSKQPISGKEGKKGKGKDLEQGKQEKKGKGKKRALGGEAGPAGEEGQEGAKKERKGVDVWMGKAMRVKAKVHATKGSATAFLQQVKEAEAP